MIQTIVVDDEWYNLEEVCDLVEKTGFMRVAGRYRNGADALHEALSVKPQVAFIDIEMPEMDGLTLAEKLLEINPEMKIVFITGWNQYAVAAFELNALDYIMKPLNKERFNKMVQRLKMQIGLMEPERGTTLSIRCFGKFEALVDGKPVVWQRTKAEELFIFLLVNHDEFIHKDILLETLWPGYERSKSLPILQTSVCKIRNIFSGCKEKVKLTYADSKYGLFLKNTDCDYIFTEKALNLFDSEKPESFEAVYSAYAFIQKGFLTGSGYWWREAIAEDLRCRLASSLHAIAQYNHRENAENELDALKKAARLSPTEDTDQICYLEALKARGADEEIVRHCEWLKETLRQDYDEELPEEIESMLKACKD